MLKQHLVMGLSHGQLIATQIKLAHQGHPSPLIYSQAKYDQDNRQRQPEPRQIVAEEQHLSRIESVSLGQYNNKTLRPKFNGGPDQQTTPCRGKLPPGFGGLDGD